MSTNEGQSLDVNNAAQLMSLTETLQAAESRRAQDRALIDILMNGRRPYTDDEVKKHQIRINVNWNEGTNLLTDANRQVNNATLYVGRFFTAKCLDGPPEKREEWGQKFTTLINRKLKKRKMGKRHLFLRKSRNASVVLHGIGPMMWTTPTDPLPRFIALEDLLIPTDTTLDLYNLQHFAVNLYYTQKEFHDLYSGSDRGWNKDLCEKILKALAVPMSNQTDEYAWRPESWQEQWKQNSTYLNSDKVPRVRLRLFVYQDAKTGKWYRRIILRENPGTKLEKIPEEMQDFVYKSDKVYGEDIDQILHVQFGDCSIVPPLKYHSVRGLGTLFYAIVEIMNRLHCSTVQAAFDNLQQLLRVQNPGDRIRQQIVQLFPYAVVEDGVGFVKNDERHVPDVRLAEFAMAQGKQNLAENASSFVQDVDNGTSKEMTATEAQARINSVNVMVGGMLQSMYGQEEYYFEEVVRRFLLPNPTAEEVKSFQAECKKAKIPTQYMKPECWEITIERVIGAGDQTIAERKASMLLSQSQRYDPTSQRKIVKLWTSVVTDNPDFADDLVQMTEPEASDGVLEAEDVFGTLMQGIPVTIREGIDRQGYIESMIGMMAAKIGKIEEGEQQGIQPTLDDLQGLDMVQQHIAENIAIFEQNQENKQLVKEYNDMLGQLNNMLKKFIQHYQEAQQAEAEKSQIDPEAQAKVTTTMMLAEAKIRSGQAMTAQKLQQNQAKFEQKLQQSVEKQFASLQQQMVQLVADLKEQSARTKADIVAKDKMATATANASSGAKE